MKKRVLSLFLAITLCLTLTPTGALAEESLPGQTVVATQETETPTPAPQKEEPLPEQTVVATQETETPTPAPQKEEPTAPAENGADENASPASPDEKPTENTPAAPEKNPADEEPGKEPAAATGRDESKADGSPSDDDAAKVQNQLVMAAAAEPGEPTMMGQNNLLALADEGQTPANAQNSEGGGIYVAPGSPTEGGGGTYISGEDTRTEIWCVSKPDSIGRSYDGTTDGGTIPIDLTFTDGTNEIKLKEGTGFTAKKTFDSADAGWHTVTVEIALIGEAAVKYKLKADEETFTIGGNINKAYPKLTVSLSKTACTAGEKLLPLLSVEGAPEDAEVTYYYAPINSGYLEFEGSEAVPKIDENTAISEPGTYYVYAKTGETKNYKEERSATVELTVNEPVAEAASVTKADGTDGGTYESLPAALNAAQDGDTVKLLADHVTDTDTLNALGENFTFEQYASIVPVVTKTLTLDLNHKTVDYLEVGFTETNEETQKKETLATGNLTVTGEAAYGRISNLMFMAGALDIRSGEIGGSGCAGLLCDANSGSVTVSNGTVYGLTVLEGASVTFKGGSKHAGEWVVASGATLNITDGTFGDVQFTRNGTIAISGGTFQSIKSYIAEELQPLMSLLDTQKVHAFYKGDDVQDGNATELADVTVKEHTHTMVNNKCACGFSCTHTNTEGASTIDKDGKCTVCGTQFAAGIGETYYTDVPSALDAATDGQTVKLLANAMLPDGIYVSKTLTLDLDGHSLSGYSLNVGGRTATGKLTVIDSSGGNGAVGVTVRDGGTLVFDPKNDHTTLLQLEVWGGTVELYGGKILRSGLRLNNNITLGNLLPQKAGLAYYRGDTQLTLAEAASQTCDLVVKSCSHGGKNGFDKSATTCPYCGAPAVAETAVNHGPRRRFADLQTALDADRNGGATLKLLADVTGDYTIDGTQDTGLDLQGYSIKGTVTVKAAAGSNTTTLSNTVNMTKVSIDKVVAYKGAKLAGSGYPAVIGTLTLAEGATWKTILNDTALGYKVLNADGTYKWYAPKDVKGSQLNNVIINRLPITTKTLNLKVDGKNLTGNSPKVERGTTVQLCASCNAKGADVYIYTGEIVGNNMPTYSRKKAEYKQIGTNWYYVVDLPCNTIGKYSVYFTATKDGYKVTSSHKTLTVTKPNLSNAEITFPYGNEAAFNSVSATGVPTFVVTYKGQTLEKDVDFTITGGDSTYDVGPCTLTIKATDNGDYTGSKSAQWTVRPLKVAASVGNIIKTYDGTTDLPENTKITFKSVDSYYTGTTLRLAKGTDYEVSNARYDSADASETEKTVSFTIKLKNAGYVFDNGTTQKDFTLNGADFDDKTFQINKATAPMNNPTGTLNIINGTQQTYTYDFNNILPGLPGGKYGTISYGQPAISLVSQSGYYYDQTIVEFKKGVLTLAQFYAKDGKMTGKIGTVKVNVTTTNYADFQLKLVLYAVDQIKPVPDGTITATPITYGNELSMSEISGKMKDPNTGDAVNGTFAWTAGTINPNAGDYEAEWTFTPAAGYEKYATATGTVTIKVNKATPTFNAPTAQENLTYTGQEQALIIAGSVTSGGTMQYSLTENGTYSQDIPTGTDAGAYTVWYRVIGDANHNDTAPASVAVSIGKKPLTITGVTAASKPYDGTTNAGITSVTFDNVTLNRGTDYTVAASFDDAGVGNGKSITATVTLTEQTAKNYALEQSSFPTTGNITKAAAPDFTKETALAIINGYEKTYTVTLPALPKLETPKGYGAPTYELGEIKLNGGYYTDGAKVENGKLTLPIQKNDVKTTGSVGTATVVIKSTNYENITLTVNVSAVNKIKPTPVGEITASEITYGDTLSKSTISGKMKDPNTGYEVNGTFTWMDGTVKPDAGSNNATWTFTPDASYGGKYTTNNGTATVTVNRKTVTVSGITAKDKVYDGNTNVVLDYSAVTLGGVLENDTLTVTATGTMESAGVGERKVRISDLTLGGDSAANYVLAESGNQTETTATITAKEVTATITPHGGTYGSAVAAAGAVDGENVPVTLTYTGNGYNDTAVPANAGSYTVTVSISNSNYTLTGNTTADFVITPKAVTVSGITAKDKVYDGNTNVVLDYSAVTLGGVLENDTLTVTATGTMESAGVGERKVRISDLTLGGDSAANYVLAESGNQTETTATITAKEVTVTITSKGGTYGSVVAAAAKLSGAVAGENIPVTLTYTGNGYDATDVPVNVGSYTVTASIANSNYTLTGNTTADFVITPKAVTVSGITANDKVYDGTTNAVLDYSNAQFDGILESDKLTVAAKGMFEKAEAGKQNVAISDLTLGGDSAANYVLAESGNQTETTATITAKKITVSITPNGGTYGGTITPATATANDVVGEDAPEITLTYTGTANDGTKYNGTTPPTKAGTYTIKASTTDKNYTLDANTATAKFTVAKRSATVTPDNKSKVYEEKDPELTYIVSGVLSGETLQGITLTRAEGENAGEYAITATADAGANPNYDVTFAKGTFTIKPKSIQNATVVLGKGLAANGAEQTQTVAKVLLVNKELPADSYTVSGNTATAHGIYTLTVTGKGNYKDSVKWTYVIAPAKAEDAPGEDIAIDRGKVKVDVQSEGTVPPATLLTDKAELLAMLVNSGDITADELVQIANGASVDIVLTVKEANVSDEVKTAMAQAAKDYTIGQYLDISLLKYMTVNGSQQAGVPLHTTKDALTISVVVPDALIHTDSAVNRNYCIVRNHEGTITVLDAAFDAAGKTLTFKTDRFSIYAIAYKDTAVPSSGSNPGSNNSSNDSETKKNEVAAPTPAPTPASTSKPSTITAMPQTGDTSNPTLYVVLLVASLLGLAVVFVCKKRNDK